MDELQTILQKVTAEMLVADVPIGLLQSSGIDSSLIALLTKGDLISFTASFNEASHDETSAAKKVAAMANHRWVSVAVEQQRELAKDFYSVAHFVDGQLADSSCLAHFALSRAARKEVTVALAGDGADEIFAGYPTYTASRIAKWVAPFIPANLASLTGNWLFNHFSKDERRLPWHEMLRRFLWGVAAPRQSQHPEWRRLTPPTFLRQLYGSALTPFLDKDPLEKYRLAELQNPGTVLDRCLLADQNIYLPADMLTKVDRMSMAHGLEIRVPFLDRRIMDFASRLPGELLNPVFGARKRILRQMLTKLQAPPEVISGSKKGFNIPLARLLRGELRTVGEELLMRNTDLFTPLLKPEGVQQLWQEHRESKRNHAYTLWALLIYGAWRQKM